jgi:hypothetical protein
LSTATCLVLFLLYDIDSNFFAEEQLAYHVFQPVFKEVGGLPYYTEISLKNRRVKLSKGKYRIGVYTNYPKTFEKRIEIREL